MEVFELDEFKGSVKPMEHEEELFFNATEVEVGEGEMKVLKIAPELGASVTNNMDAYKTNNTKNTNEYMGLYRGSLDYLYLSLVIEWGDIFEEIRKTVLDPCQSAAKENDRYGQYFQLGDAIVRVFPKGAGGSGIYRHFILEVAGVHLEFSIHSAPNDSYYNGVVRLGSIACSTLPMEDLYNRVEALVRCFGGEIINHRVTRVDIALDTPDITVGQFLNALHEGRVITRARTWSVYGESQDSQTVYIGKGPMLRVYDKLAEMKARPDDDKKRILEHRFGGQLPDTVTRFEFQLNRKFFRHAKEEINTYQDFIKHYRGVMHYLTTQWLRVAEDEVDRKHADRSKVIRWWRKISISFQWQAKTRIRKFVRMTKRVKNKAGLLRQALGCGLKAIGQNCTSAAGFLLEFFENLRKEIYDIGLKEFTARLATVHAEGNVQAIDVAFENSRPEKQALETLFGRIQTQLKKLERNKGKIDQTEFNFPFDEPTGLGF